MNTIGLTLFCCAAVPAQSSPPLNLDFARATLDGWAGKGFHLVPGGREASSADARNPARKGLLRYVFDVPHGTGRIRFHARAVLPPDCAADGKLDVLLLGAANRVVPRQIRTATGWASSRSLLTAAAGRSREYAWDVSAHGGQKVQIALVDQDDRPGCHVVCSGFRLERLDEQQRQEFAGAIQTLVQDGKIGPAARYESAHFTAWSNADPDFTVSRLRDCERLHDAFFRHFGGRGFALRPSPVRLMVVVFDSQAGFEAYLGRKMPANLVGVYHPPTNRLVIYDLERNRGIAEHRRKALAVGRRIPFDIDRVQYIGTIERQTRDYCKDANRATTMHEAAHQVSFNCGLLNRDGDVPLWLAEGLACYCEPSEKGAWQGIGAPNPERLAALAAQVSGRVRYVPLATLVGSEDWRKDGSALMPGYAQSWALFRFLMEERPAQLRSYLHLIHSRRVPEHRLTDFRQAFDPDLNRFERRFRQYLTELVARYPVSQVLR